MFFRYIFTLAIIFAISFASNSYAQTQVNGGTYEIVGANDCDSQNTIPNKVEYARWVSPGNCNTNRMLVNERLVTYVDLIRQSIYFKIDKHNIDEDDRNRMNQVINEINNSDGVKEVRLVGYADRYNTNDYNIKLSRKRAQNALNYFKSQGYFKQENVNFGYFGEDRPVTNCPTNLPTAEQVECLQADRRVDIEVEVYRRKMDRVQDTVIYDRFGNVIKTTTTNDVVEPEYKGPEGVTYEPMN